jgi:hypothetical protein
VRRVQEDQRIPRVSTRAMSSKGQESVEDVYCCTRTGYWSCFITRRRWQEVSVSIRESAST